MATALFLICLVPAKSQERVAIRVVSNVTINFPGIGAPFVEKISTDGTNFFAGGMFSTKEGNFAGIAKFSPGGGNPIWSVKWGPPNSWGGAIAYNPTDGSLIQERDDIFGESASEIARFDTADGRIIWGKSLDKPASVYTWRDQSIFISRFPITVSIIENGNGNVTGGFTLDENLIGAKKISVWGDTLFIFANDFLGKYLLPSGDTILRIPNPSRSIYPIKTFGAIDGSGNMYVAASDFRPFLQYFTVVKYDASGRFIWKNEWLPWEDTTVASMINFNNWVCGTLVDDSLRVVAVFGNISGSNNDKTREAYLAFVSTETGDTLATDKYLGPRGVGTGWEDGFVNSKRQFVLLGTDMVPEGADAYFIRTFTADFLDAVSAPPAPLVPCGISIVNYPNPFNPVTKVRYTVAERGRVTLSVWNLIGQRIATLVSGEVPPGTYEVPFDGSSLPSGVYIGEVEVVTSHGIASRAVTRMLLVK